MTLIRRIALFFLTTGLIALAGCASTDPDRDSDMPWNTPQSWEGSPAIPGMNQ